MPPEARNLIRCRYCDWNTLRFRGKRSGERALRLHVVTEHEAEYAAAQGLEGMDDDRPWTIDDAEIGEQPL